MILVACPACSRQYDVTSLSPGEMVRCLCDARIAVPSRSPLGVDALACRHCGAPVGAEEPECAHCGAALSARDRSAGTLCPGCFVRLPDDARHCSGCGLAIAPQSLAALPDGVDCPRCKQELEVRVLPQGSAIDCSACHGLWLEPEGFQRICSHAAREAGTDFFDAGDGIRQPELRPETMAYIPCLRCGELMLRKQFRFGGAMSGVVLDFCKDHGVWFDHAELERVVAFIRERGSAPAGGRELTDADFARGLLDPGCREPAWTSRERRAGQFGSGVFPQRRSSAAEEILGVAVAALRGLFG